VPAWIGTSGWQYAHWRALFYPRGLPQAAWLPHYARHFQTVEVNNTFYRLPERATFSAWAAATPRDFLFALKMSRFFTHMKRLKDPEPAVRRFLDAAGGLGSKKLGPLLLQLSPLHKADAGRLDEALSVFPRSVRVAVEFRDPSWFVPDLRRVLERRGAALCLADRGSRPVSPLWQTTDWGYVRFHGGTGAPPSCYGRQSLQTWANRLGEMWREESDQFDLFVYFNNDAHGCALRDAAVFSRALSRYLPMRMTVPSPAFVQ
jgi:uncharacterized protein YecE (DUF72 family)